jgi:hypothetical protein
MFFAGLPETKDQVQRVVGTAYEAHVGLP